jgi:hypothetical protein
MEDCRQRTLRKLEEYNELEAKIPYWKPSPDPLQIQKKQKSYALLHDFVK